jgi:hypothetical protein
MASDDHYLEADGNHTAGGRRMAAGDEWTCGDAYLGGFSAVFVCALPLGHEGSHESMGGTGWDSPIAHPGGETNG